MIYSKIESCLLARRRRGIRPLSQHPILLSHDEQGAYHNLIRELKNDDLQLFCNFLRMTPEAPIRKRIEPLNPGNDTNFHRSKLGPKVAAPNTFN